ncbi:unnamed protein product [Arabis nemorensis]|uniref:Uncharacterized protein n=1 Tax=Arabis nemorensis TaxID=586526 RepID=A0A565CMV9_9BRAS|nr:unnamed protein product [Arabis nemorensis]
MLRNVSVQGSALEDLIRRSVGQDNVVSQRCFHVRDYEIKIIHHINGATSFLIFVIVVDV